MKTALTIAGSDSSGGAGIQADIKTMTANGVYAMSAVTALTAQNTTGVYGILESTPEFLASQLDCIFTDIFPDAVKTGMVSSTGLIQVIADKLKQYQARNIVVDPVMIATSGSRLISEEAVEALKSQLLPLAAVLTPNIPEAEVLSGLTISGPEDMERAAREIGERLDSFVATVRKAHPSTPLIFIQTEVRETGNFNLRARKFESDKRAAAEAGIRRLMKDDRNIYFIDSPGMIGTDHLGTVDGSHPSDQGFMHMTRHLEPQLRKIFRKYGIR